MFYLAMATIHFKGKSYVQNHHLTLKYHHLVPNPAASLTDKISLHDNLIIHGDNLLALKALLPTYAGKVKCIYIDPPYNTGNEGWIYNDNVNSPMMQEWLKANQPIDKEDLARHDKWLCMMMPRLKLLRELLRDDDVIFISIDDNEVHHLRMLMDEIFGESNWVGTIVWKNATDNNPTNVAVEHEYIFCFSKNKAQLPSEWKSPISDIKQKLIEVGAKLIDSYTNLVELQEVYSQWFKENKTYLSPLDRYKYIDFGGIYTGSQSVHNPGREGYRYDVIHKETGKPCKQPLMGYRFPESTMNDLLAQDKILFGEDEDKIIELKVYAHEYEDKLSSLILIDGRIGAYDLRNLFPQSQKKFDNPKPTQLIKQLLSFTVKNGDIILDSFAGSGTTAHAILALNQEDRGSRKFILIEMEDYTESLTAERVRRVIKGIPDAKDKTLKNGLGGSFSFFELGDPVEMQAILEGDTLPAYEDLARYVFYTATGDEFDPTKVDQERNYIGENKDFEVYLLYQPDLNYLRSTSLDLDKAEKLGLPEPNCKKRLVFAPMKYLDTDTLERYRIEYCQLPFEIYKFKE
jgi:adenine-specific DNA-methyltransferase